MTASQESKTDAPEMVEILVDGEAHQVEPGINLLDALLELGEDVSYFCYHPGLSVVAKCRQCLVGIGDGHKLVPSCQLTTQDGMRVRSKTEQVLEARRAQLEFTLVNHPIDCVICDKAGECALQRQYMDWDAKASLVNHDKVRKPKKVDLGPEIVLDAERCILCHRCVRFCDEVAGQPQLLFGERGDHTVLTTAPGELLDNPYSLNTVDICPVGALTDKDFRFKSRVWDLSATRSTCTGCAAGCGMEIHHKGGQIYRLVPPKKWDMNENWMCDAGRRIYKAYDALERVTFPKVEDAESDPAAAIAAVAAALEPYLSRPSAPVEAPVEAGAETPEGANAPEGDESESGESEPAESPGAKVAIALGADMTNEDNWAAVKLARELFDGAKLFVASAKDDGKGDDILRKDDPNPNRAGATAIAGEVGTIDELGNGLKGGDFKVLITLGTALELPGAALRKMAKTVDMVLQLSPTTTALSKRTKVLLPTAAWPEVDGTITNVDGETKRLRPAFEPPGHARPAWDWLARLAEALGAAWQIRSPKALFEELSAQVPALEGAQWGEELRTKKLRFGGRRG
jgi:NADH-quinone oxidoreductase subunit G